ncbi:rod-binding protein [Tropicimonas isoalkanivorans]|nr:rod-binding protein [Tropicimonas isoalkanivorans]
MGARERAKDQPLMKVARDMEAAFLSEMLDYAGVGKSSDSFGGGIGEEQYASFLRDAQAKEMVKNGGIGLAEMIFESLKERTNDP